MSAASSASTTHSYAFRSTRLVTYTPKLSASFRSVQGLSHSQRAEEPFFSSDNPLTYSKRAVCGEPGLELDMPTLLDLPDEVLFIIGEQFEDDPPNLGLFLLVHPRINTSCAALRYRDKYVRFDSESPLQDYLQHKLWLKHVHSVMMFAACRVHEAGEPYLGRLGVDFKDPEQYDQDLARVIACLASVRELILEAPYPPATPSEIKTVPLQNTFEAMKLRSEIQEVRFINFSNLEELYLAFDLARNLPRCTNLELVQVVWYPQDVVTLEPLAKFLAQPSLAARLKTLELRELTIRSRKAVRKAPDLVVLPAFTSLESLQFVDQDRWLPGEREEEVLLLGQLLAGARSLVKLSVHARALIALAKRGYRPTPVVLHLECHIADAVDPEDLQFAISSSVRSMILSGTGAIKYGTALLKLVSSREGKRSLDVQRLLIIASYGRVEEMEGLAISSGVILESQDRLSQRSCNISRMANPVNGKKWAPHATQLDLAPNFGILSAGLFEPN